jgi:hypothetical protein
MNAIRIAVAFVAMTTLSSAVPFAPEPGPAGYTCHEECRLDCISRYPGNPSMQDRCTWSCIDAYCGGGPFPLN